MASWVGRRPPKPLAVPVVDREVSDCSRLGDLQERSDRWMGREQHEVRRHVTWLPVHLIPWRCRPPASRAFTSPHS